MCTFRLSALVSLALLYGSPFAFAGETATACTITVRTTMKSGDLKKRVFHSHAATPDACAEDARLHNENYFPPKISSVKVEYQFAGDAKISLPETR
ncbi:MAG: hypothetical protein JST04_05100 [Bdellovibrionales bacterium]|nr:hypothetical protein [Bdellovibrionales bacterium]